MGALGDMMVLVDFHGQQEDELNIKAGEIIRNVKKTPEDGWLEGDINGKRGFFPQIFAKEIPSVFLNDNGQRYPRSIRRVNAGVQKKKPRWCKADYSYTPGNADELELCVGEVYEILEEIEDGWWLGKKGNLMGAFPSNFVQEIEASPSEKVPEVKKNGKHRPKLMDLSFTPVDDKMLSDKPEDKPGVNQQKAAGQVTSVPTIQEFCRVMFDYTPSMQDELALKKGDVVSVVSKDNEDEGWWRGELNGKTGLFPDNFVILLPPTSQIKSNKPPTRTLTVKGPAKVNAPSADQIRPFVNGLVAPSSSDQKDITTTEKKHPEMKRPESPASAGHKAVKPEKVTVDKKVQDVNRPVSPASVAQKGKTDVSPTDKKDINKAESSSSNSQKDAKADPVPKLSHFPAKRSAPAPPVPVKGKHGVNRPTTEYSSKPSEDGKGKNKDSNTLDGLRISSVKLAHPTAERPKVQGRRMPKTKNLPEPVSVMEEEQVNSHIKSPTSAKAAPKFSTSPNQATFQNTKSGTQSPSLSTSCKQMTDPAHTAQVEELAAEIKSVKLMMEILKNKHLKDMEEIRGEISEERIKRLALQMEIESLKRFSSS